MAGQIAATTTAAITITDAGAEGRDMKRRRFVVLLAALCVGAASLSGCAVVHHRDGGVTIRPLR